MTSISRILRRILRDARQNACTCGDVSDGVRHWGLRYRAANGVPRWAVVVAPARYGPSSPSPPLPLVISPHGRGVRARTNARLWGGLAGLGDFAVVCPGGMGRRLPLHSWGWRGQIDDLARMPAILRAARPWLRIDAERVYAVGGSMGGQETLLLLGQHPSLLAGAVAFDSVTDFGLRYEQFARSPRGSTLQALARVEVGGTPRTDPRAYALRSPMHWIREIAELGRSAPGLVERRGRDRRQPAHAVGTVLQGAARSSNRAAASRRGPARGATRRRATPASSCPGRSPGWADSGRVAARLPDLHAVGDA